MYMYRSNKSVWNMQSKDVRSLLPWDVLLRSHNVIMHDCFMKKDMSLKPSPIIRKTTMRNNLSKKTSITCTQCKQ